MTRRVVGPFNRVEGDLEVHLEISGDEVREARVVSPLYRGFEQILHGKDPRDAMIYTPRICGICSVSQSVAAATALADAQCLSMPANGELAINLVLANENIADHLTHFYLFFMPDFARQIYQDEPWYAKAAERFRAVKGAAINDVLPARAEFMHLMGLLAGKWPHSLSIQPGGSTRGVEVQEKARILAILYGFRRFLEQILFADTLEHIVSIGSAEELQLWRERDTSGAGDFRHFLSIAEKLQLHNLGRSTETFMSYGVYPVEGQPLFARGLWQGESATLQENAIREDLTYSWMKQQGRPRHPYEGVTQPDANSEKGYTWCKAPRLGEKVVEVGALARQVVDGHPLIRDLVNQSGGNVRNRVIARLLEIALVVVEMEVWAKKIKPGEPFCSHASIPDQAEGCGMIEAARGSLGHWVRIKNGRILNYQIIAPTTWNFSPRDSAGVPGALEQALVNAPVRDGEKDPVSVQHIVRSFDPCMVCTVH